MVVFGKNEYRDIGCGVGRCSCSLRSPSSAVAVTMARTAVRIT
nr:MAG TPA: 16S rRNA methyltransferase [Caudoviricetes sp.]